MCACADVLLIFVFLNLYRRWLVFWAWTRRNIHVVSFAHAVVIVPLAWTCLDLPALTDDKAYGWDPRVGNVAAIASGCVSPPCIGRFFKVTYLRRQIFLVGHGRVSGTLFRHRLRRSRRVPFRERVLCDCF